MAAFIPINHESASPASAAKVYMRLDAGFPFDNDFRVVPFTPPGSVCSVQFGTKMTTPAFDERGE